MKKVIVLLFVGLISVLLIANKQPINIKGTVKDAETHNPVSGVKVTLTNETTNKTHKTNKSGEFAFQDIVDGQYSLIFSHSNYETEKRTFNYEKGELPMLLSITMRKKIEIDMEEEVAAPPTSSLHKGNRKVKQEATITGNSVGFFSGGVQKSDDGIFVDHNTESYDVINENNFKDVLNDPLSTFSIDVDRASYANVRRYLNNNQLPPKDAVRIEELINYFDYDYAPPTDGHPFSVNVEKGICPWNEQHELVKIALKGEELDQDVIPATNLVFLIDVSGSMSSPNKLPLLKSAFNILLEQMRSKDRVAIVVYAGAAGEVLPSTPGHQKEKIRAALDQLSAGGSTAGGEGIKLAYKIAKQNYIPGGNNRVILASDGDFNVGPSSNAEMVRLIESKRDDGIYLTVLGFGMGNYKDSKMELLSNAGNGNYAYIDNIMEAKKMFGQELWGTLYTIAKDVKIQIEFNPAYVFSYRLIGYENRLLNKEDFNNDKKDAGEIGAGHAVTALYEIIPANGQKQGIVDPLKYQNVNIKKSNEVMTVKLRYKNPDEDKSTLITKVYKNKDLDQPVSDDFNFASAVAEFGMLLRDSEFKANASYEQIKNLAVKGSSKDDFGYKNEFYRLVNIAELIKKN